MMLFKKTLVWQTMASQYKFKKITDKTTENLVFGYIRAIRIDNKIIPSSIIYLVIKFYHSKLAIFCIQQTRYNVDSTYLPKFNIAQLDHNKYYKCTLKSLSKSSSDIKRKHGVDWNTGICQVKNFKLPNKFISKYGDELNHKSSYDIIFTLGQGSSKYNHAYIIDSAQYNNHKNEEIDLYYWKLPEFSGLVKYATL